MVMQWADNNLPHMENVSSNKVIYILYMFSASIHLAINEVKFGSVHIPHDNTIQ